MQIPELIEKTLLKAEAADVNSVEHILEIDNLARLEANNILNKLCFKTILYFNYIKYCI